MARMAPCRWAEMMNAAWTTMSAVAALPPMALAMAAASSSGNAVQCSARRIRSGWPSAKTQMVRSARRKNPRPPRRRVASATSEPLWANSAE